MGKVAVITDSNSGITQNQAGEYGILRAAYAVLY